MSRRLLLVLTACALAGCAHPREREEARAPSASEPPATFRPEPPREAEPPPAVRPRLSRTITLGRGEQEAYQPPAPARAEPPAPTTTVVVNNTIVQPAPVYVYPAAFGGYGWTGAPSADARPVSRAPSSGTPSSSGASGWEGARGTAAPGQTPGVGGNWSRPPSYGPAQMK